MERLEVRVGCLTAKGPSAATRFTIDIDLGGGLTPRERAILFHSARHCEVGKVLTGPIAMEFKGMESPDANLETTGHAAHDGGGQHGP